MDACENLVAITEADLLSCFIVVQDRNSEVCTPIELDPSLEVKDEVSGSLETYWLRAIRNPQGNSNGVAPRVGGSLHQFLA